MAEWEEYNRLEPLGSYKQDYHFAHLCHLLVELVQAAMGADKRRKTRVMDFMPHWFNQYERLQAVAVQRQPWQEIKAKLMLMVDIQKRKKTDG